MNWWRQFFPFFRTKAQAPITDVQAHVFLPIDVASATTELLTSFRSSTTQHEGIVYWAGVQANADFVVTTVIAPTALTTSGSYQTNAVANAQVISRINQHHLQILAQIHGHPGKWVGHSQGDNLGAFMPYTGFYSVVVPHYGNNGLLPLRNCGIHRFQGNRFLHLSPNEIEQLFVIIPQCIDLRGKQL